MNTLTATEALARLAESWESDARTIARYRPDAGDSQVLLKCARDLRRAVGDHAPEWVSLRTVRARTGRSTSYLYQRCRELEATGEARRGPSGSWELTLAAALDIPPSRREHAPLEPGDLQAMARVLARETTHHGKETKGLEPQGRLPRHGSHADVLRPGLRAPRQAGLALHDPGLDPDREPEAGGEAPSGGDDL